VTKPKVSERRLLDLIGKIYEGAMDSAALTQLPVIVASHFNSESCIFHFSYKPSSLGASIVPKSARMPIGTGNFDLQTCTAYANYYHERDEWFARGWKKGFPMIVLGQELISTPALLRTEFSDFCRLAGFYEIIGAQCLITSELILAIGIHRHLGARPFDETDRRMMDTVLPHLQRAFQVHEHLGIAAAQSAAAIDMLDSMDIGLVTVGADSRLFFASGVADRVLGQGQILALRGGCLHAPYSRNVSSLNRLISEAVRTSAGLAGGGPGGTIRIEGLKGSSLAILIAPMRAASSGFGLLQPTAVLIFADPGTEIAIPERTLRQTFGLTTAELNLLVALLKGQRLSEFASAVGITYGTARIHMNRLLHKTSCHRQVDLVRTVLKNRSARLWEHFGQFDG
jgi:DNA-binding CsgD family transcriptional regulator